ncbi:alpha-amylase family glycosyl hydrolase [Acidicapsa acidisoli]|uniref:alpha-amylase family glycosyl hydrolase n=1 Tax=Acidicapsa acidisoli TaxID=1615681 RepID=UPI0021DFC091|nr:alpha-amylase family glycosyl hydrolase [Acidicapsa acidisoli]
MQFHISRAIRERLKIDGLLFSYTGNVIFANVAASRKMANELNELRGTGTDPAKTVNAGALFAMGMIDELNHALVARYRREIDPAALTEAIRWFQGKVGPENVERLLLSFVDQFPNVEVYRGKVTGAEWLAGASDGLSNREAALEELMLLWLTNRNPAFGTFRELFDDRDLKVRTQYESVTAALPAYFETRPPLSPEVGSLIKALSAPMLASPDSLAGQLDFIREHWAKYLGEDLRRVLLAIDVIKEEDLAIWMRFNPPGPDRHRHAAPGFGGEGFVGDEYVGFDDEYIVGPDGVRTRRYAAGYQAPLVEYEAFSADQAWMPNVVLIAKSTYVWLEQLSKKYGRHIHHLDHIPDEELQLLADRGITGLWLIGLWERSVASRTIKRLRGHSDAVASAYSLKEYNIAEDLGGGHAYANLRDRAAWHGLRLASDMVPNHMGIDSNWVIEHPDWFISRPDSPYPSYSFSGPDISPDHRAEIKIEDHYYDQTDAAVVFRLRHRYDGTTRYIYHGNDGTSFAWNDTAQLDYSKAHVREHVIQTILHVARQFPIIRFDAAMVLAKRHVQRLWFPLPGAGGSIPSRAESALSQEEFDALMPHEFWREVVDRVAVEVPGTLLLAEAFWMLEGYFVRTLGMHRVYNSAFMNMLRDEENAKYRSYLKKTIEFDPDILKRYVNFMSNPDERTAIDQFGWGDKFFGVCTLMATLPGLPMFGHGQIEGFTERYGMEFKRARMEEHENEGLIARHQHDIAPLLKNRWMFAESTNFVLYDFWTHHGTVDENVFAYSNQLHGQRSVVVYNNRYGSTQGAIHVSVAAMDKGSGHLKQTSLTQGLALPVEDAVIVAYRDVASGLEYLRRSTDLHYHGLSLDLRGYQSVVLLNWRELRSTAEYPWDRLCDGLEGRGVHSLDEALLSLRLRPLHEALREVISTANARRFAEVAGEPARKKIEAKAEKTHGAVEVAKMDLAKGSAGAKTPEKHKPETEAETADLVAELVDFRLRGFVDRSQLCFDRIMEYLPADLRDASEHPEDGDADSKQRYREACEAAVMAAVRLPHLERSFSMVWPPAVRYTLPSNEPGAPMEQTWAPVLAWAVLHSVPMPGVRTALFDRLQLRSSLAEAFSSMGLEGDRPWRAAAQVRLLLRLAEKPAISIESEEFFADPDVRWLAGVNEHGGTTYLNKEHFEELVCWLQLPALLAAAGAEPGAAQSVREVEAAVATACKAARAAGYVLDEFLKIPRKVHGVKPPVGQSEKATASTADLT